MVCLLVEHKVRIICVCHVISHDYSHHEATSISERIETVKQYIPIAFSPIPNVFCWLHSIFSQRRKVWYLPDGIHVNPAGQHHLQRSYHFVGIALALKFSFHISCVFGIFTPSTRQIFSEAMQLIHSSLMCQVLFSLVWGFICNIMVFVAGSLILLICVRILPAQFY